MHQAMNDGWILQPNTGCRVEGRSQNIESMLPCVCRSDLARMVSVLAVLLLLLYKTKCN